MERSLICGPAYARSLAEPSDKEEVVVIRRSWWLALVVAGSALALASCGNSEGGQDRVAVFAAASLSDAFADVALAFESSNPGIDVQLNLAGSSTLREQILQGAPADVFASANESNMAALDAAGELATAPQRFAANRLQIAVPAGNPAQVSGLEDFGNDDLLLGLCAQGVPCGDLARQALADAGVQPSVDTDEPSVRALLTKVSAGELDAGLVYVTDVLAAAGDVEAVQIVGADVRAVYPIASLANAPNPQGAEAFVRFVLSAEGQAILAEHGFEVA